MPLFTAVKNGNLQEVSNLIEKDKAIVNCKLPFNNRTALFYAAESGNEKICDILLTNGADPNLSDTSWDTPLKLAASNGHIDVVRNLLIEGGRYFPRKSADIDQTGNYKTALCRALENKRVDVAQFLYQKGAKIDSFQVNKLFWNDKLLNLEDLNRDGRGPKPLEVAAKYGLIDEIEKFIKNGAKITSDILITAIRANQINSVKYLTEKCFANVCQLHQKTTPLTEAVAKGNLAIVRYLVENGAQVTIPSALHAAVRENQTEIFKFLLSCKVNFKVENGSTMLVKAIELENTEVAGLLIKHGANVNRGDWETPLLLKATKTKNFAMIELLLENGAMDTVSGNCALAEAISQKNMIVIELLLKYRSDPDYIAHVLIQCVREASPALLNYFLKRKVNFKAFAGLAENVLDEAIYMNDVLSLQYLIDAGVDYSSLGAELNTFAQNNYDFEVYFKEVKEAASARGL